MYYENLIPVSPTDDRMELREGSNEDEDFEDCVDEVQEFLETAEEDQVVPDVEAEENTVINTERIECEEEEEEEEEDVPNLEFRQ